MARRSRQRALIDSIKAHLDPTRVILMEMDAHINDPPFADAAVQLLDSYDG